MSKKILALAIAVMMLFLAGCNMNNSGNTDGGIDSGIGEEINNMLNGGNQQNRGDSFVLKAIVKAVHNDMIEVEVIESDYAFGIYHVRTGIQTEYTNSDGAAINRSDIKSGDTIKISYSGQTMMSYPPQIVAHGIVVE